MINGRGFQSEVYGLYIRLTGDAWKTKTKTKNKRFLGLIQVPRINVSRSEDSGSNGFSNMDFCTHSLRAAILWHIMNLS